MTNFTLPLNNGRSRVMGVIWVVCPSTGTDASTGIETDAESFAALEHFTLSLTCPVCGDRHPWEDMQGYLVGDPPGRVQ